MTNAPVAKTAGGLAVLFNAILLCLAGFGVIDWSEAEIAAVVLNLSLGIALVGAVIAHFRPRTSKEPVALSIALIAFLQSVCGTLAVFDVVTETQGGLLVGVVAALGLVLGVTVTRQTTTPWPKGYPHPDTGPINAGATNPPPVV